MVYFITDGENIKIGYTKGKPENRLKQLNTGNDKKLFLLGYIQGNKDKEKELHTKFNKNRIRSNGEWFVASDELMDFINEYNNIPNTYVFKNELLNDFVMATTKV